MKPKLQLTLAIWIVNKEVTVPVSTAYIDLISESFLFININK
jgi:hypothetical protein